VGQPLNTARAVEALTNLEHHLMQQQVDTEMVATVQLLRQEPEQLEPLVLLELLLSNMQCQQLQSQHHLLD
jgi:hypothetical protein